MSNEEIQAAAERVVRDWPDDGDPSVGELREMIFPGATLLFTSIDMREQRRQLLNHPTVRKVMSAAMKIPMAAVAVVR